MATGAGPALLGRDRELAMVDDLLAGIVGGTGPTLMFSGEPGSGKTSLLAVARERAGAVTVVECRGVEWEAELPFSGLHELVAPILHHLPALPDPQQRAMAEALGLAPAQSARPLHLLAGAASLLAEATRERPVLLIADDLQWIDSPTLQVLSFVARRLRGERLGMLLATRPGTELPGWPAPPVALDPLGYDAVEQLASRRLGRPLPEPAIRDLIRAAGGNPLAIVETLGLFGDDVWLRGSLLDDPLPVGDLIERGFGHRVGALSPGTRSVLDVVATSLTDDAALLRDALRRLELSEDGLLEAERAGVLELDGARVRFSHPLLRALVHRQTRPDGLRRSHGALAAASVDPGLRAWHAASAATTTDDAIADELDAAADRFERRGGHLAAAQALAKAGELTTDPDARASRLLRAGRAANVTGKGRWARELYDAAVDAALDDALRLECELRRTFLMGHLDPLVDMAARQLALAEEARGVNTSVRSRALASAVQEGLFSGHLETVHTALGLLHEMRRTEILDPTVEFETASGIAVAQTSIGEPGPDGDFGRAMLRATVPARLQAAHYNDAEVAEVLQWLEEYELSARLCDHIITGARPSGNAIDLAGGLWARACHGFRVGAWAQANADIDEAMRVFATMEHRAHGVVLEGTLAVLQAAQGIDAFRDRVEETEALSHEHGFALVTVFTASALGLAELGAGRAAEAVTHFERARSWQRDAGHVQPPFGTWPADLVEAYALTGQVELAHERLAELRDWAERVERRWALAAVAALEGLLADEASYEAHFVEALRRYETTQDPFGQARAQLFFGQRLRRARRRVEAREQLVAALATFEGLGAQPWVEQASRELGASSATLRKGPSFDPDALTPQETQVAGMVAAGASNKEVAASMFLSPKTIETHLSRIYRKLGVTSRTQLGAKLREPEGSPGAAA